MKESVPWGVRATYATAKVTLGGVLQAVAKQEWYGKENLPEGGFILAANHISQVDPIAIGYLIYSSGYIPHIMAKKELFDIPLLGKALSYARHIPVERTARGSESLEIAGNIVADGGVVVIYPEGTITKDPDYWPMVAKTGAARMAMTTGAPLVPVGQWGIQEVLPRGAKKPSLWPRKRAQISVAPPLDLEAEKRKPRTATVLRDISDRMMYAITDEVEKLRGEPAPAGGLYNPITKTREPRA